MECKIFTTAFDKNGKKIFVGDRVKCKFYNGFYTDEIIGTVIIHDFSFKVKEDKGEEFESVELRDLHTATEKEYISNFGEIVKKWSNEIEVVEEKNGK